MKEWFGKIPSSVPNISQLLPSPAWILTIFSKIFHMPKIKFNDSQIIPKNSTYQHPSNKYIYIYINHISTSSQHQYQPHPTKPPNWLHNSAVCRDKTSCFCHDVFKGTQVGLASRRKQTGQANLWIFDLYTRPLPVGSWYTLDVAPRIPVTTRMTLHFQ